MTTTLTEQKIKQVMEATNYDRHCCNSYWPQEFARSIEREVIAAHEAKQAGSDYYGHWLSPRSGKLSDIPVEGAVVLDKEMREWAKTHGLHILVLDTSFHVMRGKKFLTVGYDSPKKALEALWESGEIESNWEQV